MRTYFILLTLLAAHLTHAAERVDHSTLSNKVLCGYQGWFCTRMDGAHLGWQHYQRRNQFRPGYCTIDYWPDTSELQADEKYPTDFRYEDGSVAQVFSSKHPKTVDRHFQWMKEHGIDGVMVQRFVAPLAYDGRKRALNDLVLNHCRRSAGKHGRVYALMYDLSSSRRDRVRHWIRDWKHVVDSTGITHDKNDKAYLHHRGKPLVAIWGLGFQDRRGYTIEEVGEFVRFLKEDPKYGGCSVMLGVPTAWRTLTYDAKPDRKLHEVLKMADIVSPWAIGRIRTQEGIAQHANTYWKGDLEWCNENGLDYMPSVFPGFSWRNMHGGELDEIPRNDGMFLWEQFMALKKLGVTMVYQAMFDEMDEGTQIFKVSNNPPVGASPFLTYKGLPEDHYLWLVGEATKVINDTQEPAFYPPLRPGFEWVDQRIRKAFPK